MERLSGARPARAERMEPEEDLFTGWEDPGLTEKGVEEAIAAGKALKGLGS
jgi:bisphosphoglycerate-dependent phosphoglycerate mutase